MQSISLKFILTCFLSIVSLPLLALNSPHNFTDDMDEIIVIGERLDIVDMPFDLVDPIFEHVAMMEDLQLLPALFEEDKPADKGMCTRKPGHKEGGLEILIVIVKSNPNSLAEWRAAAETAQETAGGNIPHPDDLASGDILVHFMVKPTWLSPALPASRNPIPIDASKSLYENILSHVHKEPDPKKVEEYECSNSKTTVEA